MDHRKPPLTIHLILALILTTTPLSARASNSPTGDRGTDMVIDLVVMRPAGLVATLVGSTVFVLGLPFTVPSGSVGESACELVQRPAAYTFTRPLGDLEGCGGADCRPCAKAP